MPTNIFLLHCNNYYLVFKNLKPSFQPSLFQKRRKRGLNTGEKRSQLAVTIIFSPLTNHSTAATSPLSERKTDWLACEREREGHQIRRDLNQLPCSHKIRKLFRFKLLSNQSMYYSLYPNYSRILQIDFKLLWTKKVYNIYIFDSPVKLTSQCIISNYIQLVFELQTFKSTKPFANH